MTKIGEADSRLFRKLFKHIPKDINLIMLGDNRVQFATNRHYDIHTMTRSGGKWISPVFETFPQILEWLKENY